MDREVLRNQAIGLYRAGNLPEAERACVEILRRQQEDTEIYCLLAAIQARTGRLAMALASYDHGLGIRPDFALLYGRGLVLRALGRFEEALASFDAAVAHNPDSAEAWNARGNALHDLKRYDQALANFDRALALRPDSMEIFNNRGNALQEMHRYEEAVSAYDQALALNSALAHVWNNRGIVLQLLCRFDKSRTSFERALQIDPKLAPALKNLGGVLCEGGHIEEGMRAFVRHAELVYATGGTGEPRPPQRIRHDEEQAEHLGVASGALGFRLADASRLAGPAVNPDNVVTDIAEQWQRNRPQLVVIDNLLTEGALEKLRRFCSDATVWQSAYREGYLGAMSEHGFANPLLAQIAEELRQIYPDIFRAHPLRYLWAFKYDSRFTEIGIHADEAAVNVNFWITPDDANLDPESGGLVVWDVAAPLDWNFEKYNSDTKAMLDFLARNNARSVTIPYRANRAVIFNSNLFHKTDVIRFKDGYLNRRINVTLLYGRRGEP